MKYKSPLINGGGVGNCVPAGFLREGGDNNGKEGEILLRVNYTRLSYEDAIDINNYPSFDGLVGYERGFAYWRGGNFRGITVTLHFTGGEIYSVGLTSPKQVKLYYQWFKGIAKEHGLRQDIWQFDNLYD